MEHVERDDPGEIEVEAPVSTFEELCERHLPEFAARLWTACCWPARMADGWQVGDFRFLIASLEPQPGVCLYGQFWSEPLEDVLVEVCSGEWSPPSVKYVQKRQRELLRSLGYRIGGEAKNFGKTVSIRSIAEAEQAAREMLRIFYDAFGFRGQWPLQLQLERDGRADPRPVYQSLTPEDLLKLLYAHGYSGELMGSAAAPVILARRRRRRFTAGFDWRDGSSGLWGAVMLDALIQPAAVPGDEGLIALAADLPGLAIRRHDRASLRVSMPIMMTGGVTADWVMQSVGYFLQAVRRAERLLRSSVNVKARGNQRPPVYGVH